MAAKFNGFTVVKTRLGITNCRKFMQNLQFLPVLLAYFEHFKHSFFHFILELHSTTSTSNLVSHLLTPSCEGPTSLRPVLRPSGAVNRPAFLHELFLCGIEF